MKTEFKNLNSVKRYGSESVDIEIQYFQKNDDVISFHGNQPIIFIVFWSPIMEHYFHTKFQVSGISLSGVIDRGQKWPPPKLLDTPKSPYLIGLNNFS